ncbi:caspase family protein [Ectothiorhodospiraceae bacterium BW-2]|nr:caspase family protein [Ectothiorhodospiraceae bacterium BW-2]
MLLAGLTEAATLQADLNLTPAQKGTTASPPTPSADDLLSQIPRGEQAGRYDIAVLVANQHYTRPGVPNVDYAHRDLAAMRAYLTQTMGFREENLIIEKDATSGVFSTLFNPDGKVSGYIRNNQSRLFIYYVGHGSPDPKTGDGYFVPVDADPDYIDQAGYSLNRFYANLKRLPVKEMIVVLDSCFSGRVKDGLILQNKSPGQLTINETPSPLKNASVMTSASGDQLSNWYPEKQHSLYTYYFLKGLQGEADQNRDRTITAGEMQSYLSEEVGYWSKRLGGTQQPKHEGRADTVLAKLNN